jgi:hypothetical protein
MCRDERHANSRSGPSIANHFEPKRKFHLHDTDGTFLAVCGRDEERLDEFGDVLQVEDVNQSVDRAVCELIREVFKAEGPAPAVRISRASDNRVRKASS